ncbi:MAG: hypothetical protein SGJ07_15750 [Rhodospirillaceae bacterium]|nr:hypothetical protein [Rhodospirillaceae bacterium]
MLRHRSISLAAIVFAALLPAMPAAAADFFLDEITCPIDGEVFTAIIGVNAESAGQRLDTRRVGSAVDPIPLPICPTSGFVIYRRDFSESELAKARELVASSQFRGAQQHANEYNTAAWIAERLDESPLIVAHFYLEASWLEERDPVKNVRYLEMALGWYTIAGDQLAAGEEKWWQVQALRVELLRRLGRFAEAQALLTQLPANQLPTGHVLRKGLVQQAQLLQRSDSQPRTAER